MKFGNSSRRNLNRDNLLKAYIWNRIAMNSDATSKEIRTPAGSRPPTAPPGAGGFWKKVQNFSRKNRGLIRKPAFYLILLRLLAFRIQRTFAPSPSLKHVDLLFIGTHHKVMTTYFTAVLGLLTFALNIPFQQVNFKPLNPKTRFALLMQSKADLAAIRSYRGVHILRDPRDMIVSGYHYHKWTDEPWVHRLDEHGESYQQKLNRLDKKAGLFLEIDHFIYICRDILLNWNIGDPAVLELRYEDMIGPEKRDLYRKLYSHLGFSGTELTLATDLMVLFEAESRSGKNAGKVAARSHIRSGSSGQWQKELEPGHVGYIDRELGPVLRKFGY